MPIPTFTISGFTHWRKWPARTGCGLEATGLPTAQDPRQISCERCLPLVASWFSGTTFALEILDGLDLRRANLPATQFERWDQAQAGLASARRAAFTLRSLYGQIPRFRLVLEVPAHHQARLAQSVTLETPS